MRTFLLTTALIIFGCTSAMATHLMGGEITMLDLGNRQYLVTLITYRDTIGIPMATSAQFQFDGPNGASFSSSTPYDSIISGNLLPSYPYGTEIYLFMDTVTLPSDGLWTVSWSNCCRNAAIQNLSNPLSESMWLTTSIVTDSASSNSTPYFLVPAAIYLPINTPWQYNPLPFDVDGDSLHWSIDQPLSSSAQACAGYVTPSSDTSNVFSIDPITGTISWTADQLGNFVATVLVEQYRNGVWVGEIRRDMQFIVVAPGQGNPLWSNLNTLPTDSNGYYSFDLVAGQNFKLDMFAGHTDSNTSVYLYAFSEVFNSPNSNAHFVQTKSSNAKGSFNWQPTSTDIRNKPYIVVFRVSDGFFTDDKAVLLNVTTAVGVEEFSVENQLNIYPNPASNHISIKVNSDKTQNLSLDVIAINGQRIISNMTLNTDTNTNVFSLDTSEWHPGMYMVQVKGADGSHSQQMLIVE